MYHDRAPSTSPGPRPMRSRLRPAGGPRGGSPGPAAGRFRATRRRRAGARVPWARQARRAERERRANRGRRAYREHREYRGHRVGAAGLDRGVARLTGAAPGAASRTPEPTASRTAPAAGRPARRRAPAAGSRAQRAGPAAGSRAGPAAGRPARRTAPVAAAVTGAGAGGGDPGPGGDGAGDRDREPQTKRERSRRPGLRTLNQAGTEPVIGAANPQASRERPARAGR